MERKGFVLRPKFVFIDGRTGATMYSESYREEILYNAQQNTPALSSYFELMDRLVPELPERAQQPEDPRHARPAEVVPSRSPAFDHGRPMATAAVMRDKILRRRSRGCPSVRPEGVESLESRTAEYTMGAK